MKKMRQPRDRERRSDVIGSDIAPVMSDDGRFMAAALRLSRHHLGLTQTNPSVGCLIVKDNVIVASAVTAIGGRPHAETIALARAGDRARGATAYVTLEPCAHHGHTPPCVEALVKSGIARVVVSVADPDMRVSGRGIAMLEANGIAVATGVMEAEGRRQLAGYLSRQTRQLPYVTLKLAVSADGMIGFNGRGQAVITGVLSHSQSHILRAESDAILIGIRTALADDPELTCRLPGLEHRSPMAIVLDRRLELPVTSRLVTATKSRPLLIVCDAGADPARKQELEQAGAEVLDRGVDDLSARLHDLAVRGISSLIVEGEPVLRAHF